MPPVKSERSWRSNLSLEETREALVAKLRSRKAKIKMSRDTIEARLGSQSVMRLLGPMTPTASVPVRVAIVLSETDGRTNVDVVAEDNLGFVFTRAGSMQKFQSALDALHALLQTST